MRSEDDQWTITEKLSAPGSRVAVEHFADAVVHLCDDELVATSSQRFGVDVRDLFFDDERPDPRRRLRDQGWTVEEQSAGDAARAFGRPLDGPAEATLRASVFFEARRA